MVKQGYTFILFICLFIAQAFANDSIYGLSQKSLNALRPQMHQYLELSLVRKQAYEVQQGMLQAGFSQDAVEKVLHGSAFQNFALGIVYNKSVQSSLKRYLDRVLNLETILSAAAEQQRLHAQKNQDAYFEALRKLAELRYEATSEGLQKPGTWGKIKDYIQGVWESQVG